MILPLISVPYLSRVMGAERMGEYSYTFSIVNYFMLISMLGISNYGNKQISRVRDNKEMIYKTFWEIYAIQFSMALLLSFAYLAYLFVFCTSYNVLAWIQFLCLISCFFDINWFFFGLEKFKITVTRNSIIKIVTIFLILLFIKSDRDVWKYTLIMSTSTLLSQMILWKFLTKQIKLRKVSFGGMKQHIKEIIVLFIPVIAYSVYKIMDKTMIGSFKGVVDLGYFEYAEKIYNMPLALITALGTIMLPKVSNMLSRKQFNEVKALTYKSLEFIYFAAFPITFGLISVSRDFCIGFLGQDYSRTGDLLIGLAFCIIFVSVANVIRTQILIPEGKNKEYVLATCFGATINLILNLVFIPKLGAVGACIGTVAAEFFVMLYQIICVKKFFVVEENMKKICKYLLSSVIMAVVINVIGCFIDGLWIRIFMKVITGGIIYMTLNIKYVFNLLGYRKQ